NLLDEYRNISEDLLERLGVSGTKSSAMKELDEFIEKSGNRNLKRFSNIPQDKQDELLKKFDAEEKSQSSSKSSGLNPYDSLKEHDTESRSSHYPNIDEEEKDTHSRIKNPERYARNSERRIREDVSDTPEKRTSTQTRDDNSAEKMVLQSEYNGKCQICNKQIIGSNGEAIFIAHKLTPKLGEEYKHANKTGWNSICLCPNCDAELTNCDNNVAASVRSAVESNSRDTTKSQTSIPIRVCGNKKEICYTQRHILQFKIGLETLDEMHKNE
ncbi:MAG TPA: hypothetical protein O0W87_04370, partial [Methanocorpusculum sp.]|nr:hypothetical protein [Methanocorpusculum sp.]